MLCSIFGSGHVEEVFPVILALNDGLKYLLPIIASSEVVVTEGSNMCIKLGNVPGVQHPHHGSDSKEDWMAPQVVS